MRQTTLSHEFVELMPSQLAEGVLYISIPYETAIHLCACGCGIKVVTPISPPEWRLTWDGDTVSLFPSVGNWQFPCRSHYWITRSLVEWAEDLSDAQIAEGRRIEAKEREAYFASRDADQTVAPSRLQKPSDSIFRRLARFFRSA